MWKVVLRSTNSYTIDKQTGARTREILANGGSYMDAVWALVECDARNVICTSQGSNRTWNVESDELTGVELRHALDTAADLVDAEMVATHLVAAFGVSDAEADRLVA